MVILHVLRYVIARSTGGSLRAGQRYERRAAMDKGKFSEIVLYLFPILLIRPPPSGHAPVPADPAGPGSAELDDGSTTCGFGSRSDVGLNCARDHRSITGNITGNITSITGNIAPQRHRIR